MEGEGSKERGEERWLKEEGGTAGQGREWEKGREVVLQETERERERLQYEGGGKGTCYLSKEMLQQRNKKRQMKHVPQSCWKEEKGSIHRHPLFATKDTVNVNGEGQNKQKLPVDGPRSVISVAVAAHNTAYWQTFRDLSGF